MLLTSSQKRALRYVLVIIALAIGIRLVENRLNPVTPYDFSAFERKFQAKFDSIQHLRKAQTADSIAAVQPPATPVPAASNRADSGFPVNINTASLEELIRLPRIGPRIAARIIAYRQTAGPFKTKIALTGVRGIGRGTLEKIRPLITVD